MRLALPAVFLCLFSVFKDDMPHSTRGHLHRGALLHRNGNIVAAAQAYRQHIAAHPGDKLGHYHLALTLSASGHAEAAAGAYAKALEIDPYYPEALNNLGILLHVQGKLDTARLCYARALAVRPNYSDAEYNYATAESDAGNYRAALLHFSRVLEQQPRRVDAWTNLSKVFLALREPGEAQRACQIALTLQPDYSNALWNRSIASLTLGQLPQGWNGFEHRGKPRHVSIPRWRGESLTGKHLLLHAEQGVGDAIQFARYCGQVEGGHITLECHAELLTLFKTLGSTHTLTPFEAEITRPDYQMPLMSLPQLFETNLASIPARAPYLTADASLVEQWRQRMGAPAQNRKIGLVWSGNPKHGNDANRSIDSKLFSSFAALDGVSFYCLQQKPLSVAAYSHSIPFAGVFDELTWSDTAAILMNLDLMICVDTATAHLAGALGRPVWTLLPYAPDWRWMLERNDSPWYPTMRLFRQPKMHDWQSVIQDVANELQQFAR
jgi:tetratricopeptide (TPR) repeat protein